MFTTQVNQFNEVDRFNAVIRGAASEMVFSQNYANGIEGKFVLYPFEAVDGKLVGKGTRGGKYVIRNFKGVEKPADLGAGEEVEVSVSKGADGKYYYTIFRKRAFQSSENDAELWETDGDDSPLVANGAV